VRADPQQSQLRATVDATSIRVREGHGGVKPLTDSDREEIRRNLQQKVLATDRNPEITFVSTAVHAVNDGNWQVTGELTIAGTTSTVQIPVEVEPGPEGTRMNATVRIAQSSFGIKPFSALMGSLKVADDVEIRAAVLAPAGESA
jgi:polyisoprenoid-binding protein YceI